MANRRPVLTGPSGAVLFAPSETADTVTPFTSPVIKVPTRMGQRLLIFTLDGSDNLTVTEVDLAGNTVGSGIIVNAVNVPVSTQLVFRIAPTNLGLKAKLPGISATQVSPQHGNDGGDVCTFINNNTGISTPNRAMAGTSLEVGEGIGPQVGN